MSSKKGDIITQRNFPIQELPGSESDSEHLSITAFDNDATAQSEFSLRDFLKVLRRRKAIAIQTFLVVLVIGIVMTLISKPLYRSTSRILVGNKAQSVSVNNTSDPLSNLFLPSIGHGIDTQVQILSSEALISKVLKEVHPEPKDLSVDVHQVASTDVVEISTTARTAKGAEAVSKRLPEVYLNDVKSDQLRQVTTALDFAKKQLKEKKGALEKASLTLEKYKNNSQVVDTDAQKKTAISAAAAAQQEKQRASAVAASAAARLTALKAIRHDLPATINTPVTTTNNKQITELQTRLADLRSEKDKLLYLYKPNDDHVIQVDKQIVNMKQRLAQAPKTITTVSRSPNPALTQAATDIAAAKAAYSSATADLRSANAAATKNQAALGKYNPIERTQLGLQRDIDENTASVLMLAKSVEELGLRKTAESAAADPATIIASASSAQKISPRVTHNIVLSLLLGLLLGCAAAMLQNSLDDHIRDDDQARQILNTPVLGYSPILSQGHEFIGLSGGNPQLLERFRVLRSNVQFSLFNRPRHSVLVTSTGSGEGKTSTAYNLAIAMAMDKRSVILVDADMRHPQMHEVFGVGAQPGLADVLADHVSVAEALRETDIPGLRLLTAGTLPPNSVELLNSSAMDDLHSELEENSDVIIFDSPPLLATADAQVLASRVDGVLYVIESGKVHKSHLQRAYELLHHARAHIIGIVLNKDDQKKSDASYAYGYDGEHITDMRKTAVATEPPTQNHKRLERIATTPQGAAWHHSQEKQRSTGDKEQNGQSDVDEEGIIT